MIIENIYYIRGNIEMFSYIKNIHFLLLNEFINLNVYKYFVGNEKDNIINDFVILFV